MMDRGRPPRNVNEAASRFAETLAESYRLVYEQSAQSGERQRRLAQKFSELVAQNLREQTESSRAAAEQLSEQAQKQQEAGRALAQESVEAYAQFLDDAFSQYRSGTQRAAQSAQQTTRNLSETAMGLVGTATGTASDVADTTADATQSAAESATGEPPIEGYDELNVGEVTSRLDGLSEAELRRVRDYESRNKNRQTILDQVDRKTQSAS